MRCLIGVVITHLVAVGCYRPEVLDCTVECGAPTDCAGEQVCKRGWCAAEGVMCDEHNITVDSGQDTAPPADSSNGLCEQGCSQGTCQAGVCVIDCSAAFSCENDVTCPAGIPCRVVCGDHACGHKINCTQATSCDIRCLGDTACDDEIQCGTGECAVTCSGPSSCHKRTKCASACACDVTCTGLGSCPEASECPESWCRVGNGCTSVTAGCDDCP